jgi:hypothetical protein
MEGTMEEQHATFYVARTSLQSDAVNKRWTLSDSGDQTYDVRVLYPQAFEHKPTVVASVTAITHSEPGEGTSSLRLSVHQVKKDSFEIRLTKSGDPGIEKVDVEWVALPD